MSVCQKESRHDMHCAEIFVSEGDSEKLNILGSNKLINLPLLIFYNVDLPNIIPLYSIYVA